MNPDFNLQGRDDLEFTGVTGAFKKENLSLLKLPDLGKLKAQATTPLSEKFTLLSLGRRTTNSLMHTNLL